MAANLSETLKKADLQRFATRAAQLERARSARNRYIFIHDANVEPTGRL